MTLVEKDQVEKICRQGLQPSVFGAALELADIRDDDVGIV